MEKYFEIAGVSQSKDVQMHSKLQKKILIRNDVK